MPDAGKNLEERRPSPDALLELAQKESRGRLKVFLGMAPGVGKTYAMLSAARAQQAEGVDVVVGVVETHGRADTAAVLDGLEVLPRRAVSYRGRTLMEFDVEAAIARRPALLLVDEFAHTNAAGLLHPKRYQDVEEVLKAGIDVWTTLNIQHLESLTDVVQRITGITVRETVPDTAIEDADEIVVVDLPPGELIQRLKEGKVYLPENALRAVDQFFKPSNLTALRELALRRTVDRVDEQMLAQLRQQGVEGPWPTAERLLVCVGGDENSDAVVRAAARMATTFKSDWIALHMKANNREINDRKTLKRIEKAMRLAERLGATTIRLNASDLTAEILAFAKRNNITQILIGRSGGGLIERLRGRRLSSELIRHAQGLSIVVIAPDRSARPRRQLKLPTWGNVTFGIAVAAPVVAAAILAGLGLERLTTLPNLSMVFLLAVLLCALWQGLSSAIAAAVLSFLGYNFFFIDPRFSFTVAEPHELFALVIFLVVAIVTGGLAGRLREQAMATASRANATQSLFDFSRKLSAAPKLDDVLWLLASQAALVVKGKSIVLMSDGRDLTIQTAWPPEDDMPTADWAAARWAFKEKQPAGKFTSTLPTANFQFRPLGGTKGPIAVLGIAPNEVDDDFPAAIGSALQSIIEQASIAIDRTLLVQEAARAETAAEGEKLRGTLLSSISHDLRTPLASILGSASSLRTLGERMSQSERTDLLITIEEEAARLSRFVSDLLDMSRLEAGAINIRRDWVDIGDVVQVAVQRAGCNGSRAVTVNVARHMPLIQCDATLLGQVMINLIDNSIKYSEAASAIVVDVKQQGDQINISVTDEGTGIPPEDLSKVFEKFYRVAGSDGRSVGTGLGLSICAGLIKAMGGSIAAASPIASGRGTRVTILLPVSVPSQISETGHP